MQFREKDINQKDGQPDRQTEIENLQSIFFLKCMQNHNIMSKFILPCSTCSTTRRHFLAANPPMDTWSSVPALVVKESMEAGWHRTLFSDTTDWKHNTFLVSIYIWTRRECILIIVIYCWIVLPRAAAVQWAIMNPEFSPPSGVRKAASSLYAEM